MKCWVLETAVGILCIKIYKVLVKEKSHFYVVLRCNRFILKVETVFVETIIRFLHCNYYGSIILKFTAEYSTTNIKRYL